MVPRASAAAFPWLLSSYSINSFDNNNTLCISSRLLLRMHMILQLLLWILASTPSSRIIWQFRSLFNEVHIPLFVSLAFSRAHLRPGLSCPPPIRTPPPLTFSKVCYPQPRPEGKIKTTKPRRRKKTNGRKKKKPSGKGSRARWRPTDLLRRPSRPAAPGPPSHRRPRPPHHHPTRWNLSLSLSRCRGGRGPSRPRPSSSSSSRRTHAG